MRLEATVPDSHGKAVLQLEEELGVSRSDIINEALALFLKAVLEVRNGRRLVTIDPRSTSPSCELATPTLTALTALEWALRPERLELPDDELLKMNSLARSPPKPGGRAPPPSACVDERHHALLCRWRKERLLEWGNR